MGSKKRTIEKKALVFRQMNAPEVTKGDLRKLQIVEATIACMAERGLRGTNYESVARTCGMKRPHVAYHFPDFEALLVATCRYVYGTGQAIVVDYLRETEQTLDLRCYIEGTFHWLSHHKTHAPVILALWHLATVDPVFRKLSAEFKTYGSERVYSLLFPGKPDKRSASWKVALAVHGLIVGFCVDWMTGVHDGDAEAVVSQVHEAALALAGKRK